MPKKPTKKATSKSKPGSTLQKGLNEDSERDQSWGPTYNQLPKSKPEPKRIIFRLYECVIHLEQAEKHLNGVGIFPTNIDATELNDAKEIIDGLRRQYVAAWNEMQKEAGL